MKALVTGGAGFIGSHIVDALLGRGYEVSVVDNFSSASRNFFNNKARIFELDITDNGLDDIFQQVSPDVVFHYAAQIDVRKSFEKPVYDAKINILGSLRVIEAARYAKCQRIIFASSGGAILGPSDVIPTPDDHPPHPISPYGVAKLSVEQYLWYYHQMFGLSYAALRFSNVYGPRQNALGEAGVVAIFLDKIASGKTPVIYGDGKQTRDFVFVEDVVRANMLALDSSFVGSFNVSTGTETSINELASIIQKVTGYTGEFTYAKPRQGDQARSCLDNGKIQNAFAWKPEKTLEQGIDITSRWFLKHRGL